MNRRNAQLLLELDRLEDSRREDLDFSLVEVMTWNGDVQYVDLARRIEDIVADLHLNQGHFSRGDLYGAAIVRELVFAPPREAAMGINPFLRVADAELYDGLRRGVTAIVEEFERNGTETDLECLDYVLRHPAGSSQKIFPNSPYPRDCDENGVRRDRLTASGEAMAFHDFVSHPHSQMARLSEAHVLALRLYTTSAYSSLNSPLRNRAHVGAHPMPVTVKLITEAVKQLRSVALESDLFDMSRRSKDLWRGMRDSCATTEFLNHGGTEIAPMSVTSQLEVAIRYCASETGSVLFRLRADSFMQLGADLRFLSCFPGEDDMLYPPLTYLKPLGEPREVTVTNEDGALRFTVIDVQPHMGS
jgi:hypothetical protein